jgi:hypothetical protein
MKEMNANQYKFKKTYLEERERATKKVFTKPPEMGRKPKAIDYSFNINNFKCNK